MRVLVTGGSGQVGSLVVAELARRGHVPVPGSRRTGLDLATGEGLRLALADVDAVAHCADTTSAREWSTVTVGGTTRVVEALADAPRPLVTISILGCEVSPFRYYRAKAAADAAVLGSALPATVVRATQFHSLAARLGRSLTLGPVAVGIRGMAVQPCDPAWVAGRMVDVLTGPDRPGVLELAGPDLLTLGDVAQLVADHRSRQAPRMLGLPAVGATMRSFARRDNCPRGEVEVGGRPFSEWLAEQPG